ncbi:MAG: cation transporter [Lachnospiraceae bacterium]|nr:cation transporter [Lachnospiraceae bacterium]
MSKKSEALTEQYKIAVLLVIWKIPNFVTSFVAACASRSMVLWLEFIENASIFVPGIILLILSRKLNKNLKFKYNYGTEKVEAITALSCEMFDLAGLFCIVLFAVRKLMHGSEEGEEYLLFALIVSIIGFLIDIFIVNKEKKLVSVNHSKMLHTAYISAQKEFVFDIISMITLVIEIIFVGRSWISYFAPAVSIVLAIPFSLLVIKNLKKSLIDLTDLTLDEENQLRILKILSEFYEEYETLGEIKSRMNGEKIYVDIELSFRGDRCFRDIRKTVAAMKERVTEELGKCTVNVIII